MKAKDKVIDSFIDEEKVYTSVSVVNHKKDLTKLYWLSFSVLFNFLLNIVYMSLVYYHIDFRFVDILVLLISVLWAVVSLIASYVLGDEVGNNVFYLNVFVLFFLTKIWFIYF